MNKLIFKILLPLIILQAQLALAQKRPEVGGQITTGPSIQLLSIGIDNFRLPAGFITMNDSLMAGDMKKILKDDLAFSLYFNVVEIDTAFLNQFAKGTMSLDDWIYLGAQMLVSGRIDRESQGIIFTVDVTDAQRNKNVYSRDFVGDPAEYRYLVHRVAADLLFNLTGEQGVYQSKIIYSSDASGNSDIYICDFDGYGSKALTNDKAMDVIPTWAADNQRIYYTGYKRGNPDLYAYNLADSKTVPISTRTGLNMGAAASPDGKYIAATLSLSGNSDIYLLDASGRIVRQLTFSKMIDTSPTWAPSSREIAFTSDKTGLPQIYITDSEGLNMRRLTYSGDYNDEASWSPRGDLIAYTSRTSDGFQIFAIDIAGLSPQRLTDVGYNETPTWSPDGLHITYSSNVTGTYQLWQMDYNGMNKRQLQLPGNCMTPDWSKNQKSTNESH
jgi:TolB protein